MKKIIIAVLACFASICFAQQYGNLSSLLIPSAATTSASVVTADQTNQIWRGAQFIINVSSYTSGNYTPHIQGKDPISGTYYDICVGSAISSTGTTVIKLYPGIVPSPNAACSDILPRTWRFQMVGASTPSATFSVGAFLEQ